ncbi:CotH kinase family protein, partial [Klebsiella pneumoniae]|uniref:CotH kinase family protein n=1 Tax=Klebsiella pneumoniae TaxID=573 RepID=UPI00190FB5A2
DELGNDSSASLLGLPAESDWNFRNPYSDKCLMNDFLGYELWEDMGHYSCRRRLVEMFVDTGGGKLSYPNDYYGVMVLFERIEQ